MLNVKNPLRVSEKKKFWFIGSAALIVIGLLVIAIFGLNLGVDFTGGATLNVTTGSYIEASDANANEVKGIVADALAANKLEAVTLQKSGSGATAGYEYKMQLKLDGKAASDEDFFNALSAATTAIQDNLGEIDGITGLEVTFSSAGAVATNDLISSTMKALSIAIVLILIYIIFRFTFASGLAAIVALAHDCLIMLAVCAICRVQINTYFIAAILTIVGYSINNTIIVFDRLRENAILMAGSSEDELVNKSIADMFTRMIHTTVTTLVVIAVLVILGGSAIREFGIPIIVGLLAGAYSSICIAGPLWTVFRKLGGKIKAKKKYKAAKAK
ncbi:MAG: protein translocase subunit SecF [Clostridia bacterium]|nr:protein translocase subunit SecF [Clostridia bacterium]